MNIEYLKNFIAIVEEGTILGASKKLYIAQPSLSNQIQYLENEYDCKLIIRGSRKIKLTQEGEVLYKKAKNIIELLNQTKKEIDEIKIGIKGNLSIALPPSIYSDLVRNTFAKFINNYPNIHLSIYEMTSIKAKEYLLQGICELAIVNADINDDLLEEKNIYEEKFFCFDFTEKNNNNFDITKLNNNKVIYPRVYDTYLQNYFKENNINVEVPVVTTSTISSLEMGRLMKTFVIAPMPEKEKINIFIPVYSLPINKLYIRKIYYLKNHNLSHAAKLFLECLD